MAPVDDPFQTWLIERGRSEQTAYVYASDVRQCKAARTLVAPLTSSRAPATKRRMLCALKAWANFKDDDKLLASLAEMKLEALAPVVEKVPLSDEDWTLLEVAIDDVTDPYIKASLQMICVRGFRVGAIPALTKRQVNDALRTGVLVFKSKQRTIRYSAEPFATSLEAFTIAPENWPAGLRPWPRAQRVNARWKHVADLLSPSARPETRWQAARKRLQRSMQRVAKAAGIPPDELYPHRLRRTYAEAFYRETKDLVQLREHMGWRDLETAARYVTRDRREELDRIAEGMRRKRKRG